MATDEIFDLVDESGQVIGAVSRREAHGNPAHMHRASHVLVLDREGRFYLQKRSPDKDIQPGKWDTSVGGHAGRGENPEETARREMKEELGVEPGELKFLYRYVWKSPVETELVSTFLCRSEGPMTPDPGEISEGRFWARDEIEANLGRGVFTPNFEEEFLRFTAHLKNGS